MTKIWTIFLGSYGERHSGCWRATIAEIAGCECISAHFSRALYQSGRPSHRLLLWWEKRNIKLVCTALLESLLYCTVVQAKLFKTCHQDPSRNNSTCHISNHIESYGDMAFFFQAMCSSSELHICSSAPKVGYLFQFSGKKCALLIVPYLSLFLPTVKGPYGDIHWCIVWTLNNYSKIMFPLETARHWA